MKWLAIAVVLWWLCRAGRRNRARKEREKERLHEIAVARILADTDNRVRPDAQRSGVVAESKVQTCSREEWQRRCRDAKTGLRRYGKSESADAINCN